MEHGVLVLDQKVDLPDGTEVLVEIRPVGDARRAEAAETDATVAWARRHERPAIVCLCGSTRFWRTFQEVSLRETLAGRIVLTLGGAGSDDELFGGLPQAEHDRIKAGLAELHRHKIALADEILVLNVGGYIGPSTQEEIAHARRLGKLVRFLEPQAGTGG